MLAVAEPFGLLLVLCLFSQLFPIESRQLQRYEGLAWCELASWCGLAFLWDSLEPVEVIMKYFGAAVNSSTKMTRMEALNEIKWRGNGIRQKKMCK
jgi:hypothetical protein